MEGRKIQRKGQKVRGREEEIKEIRYIKRERIGRKERMKIYGRKDKEKAEEEGIRREEEKNRTFGNKRRNEIKERKEGRIQRREREEA